jgi:hypothetical protein
MNNEKPTQCIDPEYQYCQCCKYGYVNYPAWVETSEDLIDCSFESGCLYGFDKNEERSKEK